MGLIGDGICVRKREKGLWKKEFVGSIARAWTWNKCAPEPSWRGCETPTLISLPALYLTRSSRSWPACFGSAKLGPLSPDLRDGSRPEADEVKRMDNSQPNKRAKPLATLPFGEEKLIGLRWPHSPMRRNIGLPLRTLECSGSGPRRNPVALDVVLGSDVVVFVSAGGKIIVHWLVVASRDNIRAGEPTIEVDVGAPFRAEGLEGFHRGFTADGAFSICRHQTPDKLD
jgi:hypothetical protein